MPMHSPGVGRGNRAGFALQQTQHAPDPRALARGWAYALAYALARARWTSALSTSAVVNLFRRVHRHCRQYRSCSAPCLARLPD